MSTPPSPNHTEYDCRVCTCLQCVVICDELDENVEILIYSLFCIININQIIALDNLYTAYVFKLMIIM